MMAARTRHSAHTNRDYAVALGRACAGATIFALPLLMTLEMWSLGVSLSPWMLIQFTLVQLVILYGLSHVAGFEASASKLDDLLDSLAAYGVAVLVAALMLVLLGVIDGSMPPLVIAGKVAIQAVPASFGAMLGAKLMGEGEDIEANEHWRDSYSGGLFLMLAGALFLCFTVAPTEEMRLIAFRMTPWHSLLLALLSLLLLHAILYHLGFAGQKKRIARQQRFAFFRHTVPGYAIAILASSYILWSFGHLSGLDPQQSAMTIAVLALPAAIGAGISRIVV